MSGGRCELGIKWSYWHQKLDCIEKIRDVNTFARGNHLLHRRSLWSCGVGHAWRRGSSTNQGVRRIPIFTEMTANRMAKFESKLSSRQWRRQGEGGKLPPYVWTSKNVICVCFHCHGTSSYHTTNRPTLQGCRAKSRVDTQTIQPGLGDFVL